MGKTFGSTVIAHGDSNVLNGTTFREMSLKTVHISLETEVTDKNSG